MPDCVGPGIGTPVDLVADVDVDVREPGIPTQYASFGHRDSQLLPIAGFH